MAKLFPILAVSGLSIIGAGGWYGFSGLRPKNLKQYLEWQGFESAFHASGLVWKSILAEHKEIVTRRTKKTNPTESDIKDWCIQHLYATDYESFKDDASKICVNNPETVRAKIIQQDGDIKSLIEGSEGDKNKNYKVAYIFRKHITGFLGLISFTPPEKGEGIEGGGRALEKWCKKSLDSKPDDFLVANVKSLCSSKGFNTIKELIEKQSETGSLLTDSNNQAELIKKHNSINEKSSWLADAKETSNQSNYFDLKEWCTTYMNKNFYDEGTFSDVYPKFRFRCLKS
ncbi:hypothetical protein MHC_04050 [Mycoplasma haemocanis str. Illinois]|uniref:Uncharacterized protein n=1 Tax=Mycoplasma haemocanis (strain Illinois) TaxID=1111676 RepID=H6N7P4_MYCHN|nr:hypothetical protein [Mycoplasma haemocanis]AEW45666.1 hypothetical protein MHC_04050 [Mycoplasma haemocanis str. Illinois]